MRECAYDVARIDIGDADGDNVRVTQNLTKEERKHTLVQCSLSVLCETLV